MAGDWIKMRADLRSHPKVVRMASALKADRLRIVGGLHAVWCLFDAHSVDGQLAGYTLDALDELIGWPGFGAAMIGVQWLEDQGTSLSTPRFDEHNGQSAKRRATESERKRNDRKTSAPDADKKRTREEKRREETLSNESVSRTREGEACMAMKLAGMADVNPSHPKLVALLDAGLSIAELAEAAAHAVQNGKPFAYALATAEGRRRDSATSPLPAPGTGETAYQRSMRERVAEFSPGIARRAPNERPLPETFDMELPDVLAVGRN